MARYVFYAIVSFLLGSIAFAALGSYHVAGGNQLAEPMQYLSLVLALVAPVGFVIAGLSESSVQARVAARARAADERRRHG